MPDKINLDNVPKVTVERELELVQHALDKSAIVAITDQTGKIIHVNDKFCEISKYPREELLGQNHRLINSGYHSKEFFTAMWKTIAHGEVWEGEIKNRAKDGSYYWVNTTIVPFVNPNGKPYQYVSIRYEITQRKAAEEQLRVYADRLEHSNRELTDFASIAAHDLQEPLRKIQAFGDRLNTRYGDQLPDEGRDFLSRMLTSANRMRRLIDDLLTYSRVATQAKPFEPTDLNIILKDVLSDLELRMEQVGGKVDAAQLPVIEADASQMRQLFQNLIANGLKFHKKDMTPIVKISSTVKNGRCLISVQDNGIGFEDKYLDRIFTIFQRLHGRQEYEGTGVGLAVCRRIVERHNGSITARGNIGVGACFEIALPMRHFGE
ncbi:MAG: PAS domain-containing sensor histidine kinase [Bdellovibrionota bacterium]